MDGSATKWAIPAVEEALDRGWVIVGSDYSGQGADGLFPYLVGPGEARSSLDAVRAADQISGLSLSIGCRGLGPLAGRARGALDGTGGGDATRPSSASAAPPPSRPSPTRSPSRRS